jgi:hypothetical protein
MNELISILGLVFGGGCIGVGGILSYNLWQKRKKARRFYLPPDEEEKTEEVSTERVKGKIDYEIVRETDPRSTLMKKGRIGPRRKLLHVRVDNQKRTFYANHIIKETKGKRVRYFVRWYVGNSEAFNKESKIIYDSSLENHLMDDMENQLGKAVGAAVGFVLERPMLYVMGIAFLVAMPIGFNFPNLFPSWAPSTIVHWIPRA